MGKTKGLYKAEFPEGSLVRIASKSFLEHFQKDWRFHNKLGDEQIPYADYFVHVESVGYYHGGDELYKLSGVPGIWHEACLISAT